MYELYLSKAVQMINSITSYVDINIFKTLYLPNISHLIFLFNIFSNMQMNLILAKNETLFNAYKIRLDLH